MLIDYEHVAGRIGRDGVGKIEPRGAAGGVDDDVAVGRRAGERRDHAGRSDLPDRAVIRVAYVDVIRSIHGDAAGIIELGGRSGAIGRAGVQGTAGKSRDHAGRRDLANRVVVGIGDIDVARAVRGQAAGNVEFRAGPGAVVVSDFVERAGEGRDNATGRNLADRVGAGFRNIKIPGAVGRDTVGPGKTGGRAGAVGRAVLSRHASIGRDRSVGGDFPNRGVEGIRDEEIARGIYGGARGSVEAGGSAGAVGRAGLAGRAGERRERVGCGVVAVVGREIAVGARSGAGGAGDGEDDRVEAGHGVDVGGGEPAAGRRAVAKIPRITRDRSVAIGVAGTGGVEGEGGADGGVIRGEREDRRRHQDSRGIGRGKGEVGGPAGGGGDRAAAQIDGGNQRDAVGIVIAIVKGVVGVLHAIDEGDFVGGAVGGLELGRPGFSADVQAQIRVAADGDRRGELDREEEVISGSVDPVGRNGDAGDRGSARVGTHQGEGLVLPGGNRDNGLAGEDADGRLGVGGSRDGQERRREAAVAQLAVVVEAPGEYKAVGSQGDAVTFAARDRGDGFSGQSPAAHDRDRHRRVGRGAVAELTADVLAPRINPAGGSEGEALVGAARDAGDRLAGEGAGEVDGHRNQGRGVGAVAQLAAAAIAPGIERAVGGERQRVIGAGGDLDDRLAGQDPGATHRHRHGGKRVARAVAEVAEAVEAPGENLAVGGERVAGIIRGGDAHDGFAGEDARPVHGDGHGGTDGGVVAELAGAVVAPGENLAVGGEREAVKGARGDGGHGLAGEHARCVHGDGDVGVVGRTVAQLAAAALAPADEIAVGGEGDGVGAARGDGDEGAALEECRRVNRNRRARAVLRGVAQFAVGVAAPRNGDAAGRTGGHDHARRGGRGEVERRRLSKGGWPGDGAAVEVEGRRDRDAGGSGIVRLERVAKQQRGRAAARNVGRETYGGPDGQREARAARDGHVVAEVDREIQRLARRVGGAGRTGDRRDHRSGVDEQTGGRAVGKIQRGRQAGRAGDRAAVEVER